ncbi:hypothetical protein FA95DRAFT_1647893 [Auriscalpium vulgare]|uniref:Uncharacterized protein n=1 Tax=Auriscalpium vulgare TaxID=40419 RepID=A0ACB8RAL2_9AGAM|nr:hypothetical protein FA95DRAFT_1647893 [Auriscalpium vulgare]
MSEHKDATRVAAGLKAAMHNPNVSAEAKADAEQRLEHMGAIEHQAQRGSKQAPTGGTHEQRVMGGYKATLSNPNTSEHAKAHAREVLEAAGYLERPAGTSEEEHETRVLAGYKAALHNPRVSDAAKQHAREYLGERDSLRVLRAQATLAGTVYTALHLPHPPPGPCNDVIATLYTWFPSEDEEPPHGRGPHKASDRWGQLSGFERP